MKRRAAALLVLAMLCAVTGGCAKESAKNANEIKTGLALRAQMERGEGENTAQITLLMTALLMDGDGIIADCHIETRRFQADIGNDGSITEHPSQGETLAAEEFIGKSAQEAAVIAAMRHGSGGLSQCIEEAAGAAKQIGARQGDRLSAACQALEGRANASEESAGAFSLECTAAAVTIRGDTISSCVVDALEAEIGFDESGAFVSGIGDIARSKNALGEKYGMAKASSIGREWHEQAAAFSQYVQGKTAQETANIGVTQTGGAQQADLRSGCTISIAEFKAVVEQAARGAAVP